MNYRTLLQVKLKESGLNQRQIATAMGWASQGAVSHKLNGLRDWSEGELGRMCELAGISVCWLAANSDDLKITQHPESAQIAAYVDSLGEEKRIKLLALVKVL